MRVLIVKTSSLGDLIHSFPALTDAARARPDLEFHWLVEEAFHEVPWMHPAVSCTALIALRRWRRAPLAAFQSGEIRALRRRLRRARYDLVIDAQGLLKSALPARWAGAPVAGFDHRSAREPLAAAFYQRRLAVPRRRHAIERLRRLFAQALDYPLPDTPPDYGLAPVAGPRRAELIFFHATTWPSKHWPPAFWTELARRAQGAGYRVLWPWGNERERRQARWLQARGGGEVLPRLSLTELKTRLTEAAGAVGVDTGLAHLAAALGTPAVTLYGPTDPNRTGTLGRHQRRLGVHYPCAPCLERRCSRPSATGVETPCFGTLTPARVWAALEAEMRPT